MYVYTSSRVLNQNVPFTDEAATKWYKQSVIFEDFDSKGPMDLFDDYDNVSSFDTLSMSTDNENTQGRSEEHDGLQLQGQGIEEDGQDLQDWTAQNINELHIEPPREREQSLPLANSTRSDASLSTNHILHGGQQMDNQR